MRIKIKKLVTVSYEAKLSDASAAKGNGDTPEEAVAELFRQLLASNNSSSSIIIEGLTVNLHDCIIEREDNA